MTTEILKSLAITALDATPIQFPTAGEGRPGSLIIVDDYVQPTQLAAGDYYRLCRIPTDAKIKSVVVASDKALDSNGTSTLVLDLNVIFSDSTTDGTRDFLQSKIPTTALAGATTTIAAYASPNIMFGSITVGNNTKISPTNYVFNKGSGTAGLNMALNTQTPLWEIYTFTDGQGYPHNPGGFMDLLIYVSTGAATAVITGALYARIEYVV